MYRGIVLKNADKPRYLNSEQTIDYKVERVSGTSLPASREVIISYDRLPEERPEEFFAVGTRYMYHDTTILSPH